jgi:hypothetical protein
MAISQGTSRPKVAPGKVPTIYNVPMATANTEYSQALPANTRQFIIRSRTRGRLKISYTLNESGTKYVTIQRGNVFSDENIDFSGTLYFQSSNSSDVAEIRCWT